MERKEKGIIYCTAALRNGGSGFQTVLVTGYLGEVYYCYNPAQHNPTHPNVDNLTQAIPSHCIPSVPNPNQLDSARPSLTIKELCWTVYKAGVRAPPVHKLYTSPAALTVQAPQVALGPIAV